MVTAQAYAKPAVLSAASGLVAVPVNGTFVPSGTVIVGGSLTIVAIGSCALTTKLNWTCAVRPFPSSAVMVTVSIPASSPAGFDQVYLPALQAETTPSDALSVTVSPSGSEQVPVFAGAVPSGTLTAALSTVTTGAELVGPATTHSWKPKSPWLVVNQSVDEPPMYWSPAVYGFSGPLSSHLRLPIVSSATMAYLTPLVTVAPGDSQKSWSWQQGTNPETEGAAPRMVVGWPLASVSLSVTVYAPKPVGV